MTCKLDSHHTIQYANRDFVPVYDLATSLIALEKVVSQSVPVIATLLAVDIAGASIYVESIRAGSLQDNFIVRFFFGGEAEFNRFIAALRRRTGVEAIQNRYPLFGPILTAAIVAGGITAATRSCEGDAPGTTIHLQEIHNSVIAVAARDLHTEPAEIAAALHSAIPNRYVLATNAVKLGTSVRRPIPPPPPHRPQPFERALLQAVECAHGLLRSSRRARALSL